MLEVPTPFGHHASKSAVRIAVATMLAVGLFLFSSGARLFAQDYYRLLSIEDGDTLLVEIEGKAQRLQLLGIDAPEDAVNPKFSRDQQRTGLDSEALIALGRAATRHLESLIKPGQAVKLEGDLQRKDRYGRIPVAAYNPAGRALNEAMVEDGYSVVLNRYPLDDELRNRLRHHEKTAIAEGRGLWGAHPAATAAWSGRGGASID